MRFTNLAGDLQNMLCRCDEVSEKSYALLLEQLLSDVLAQRDIFERCVGTLN